MRTSIFAKGRRKAEKASIIRSNRAARTGFAVFCAVVASVCMAAVDIDSMPQWTFADTEVSTNCPLPMAKNPIENVRCSLELVGLASNNVEVAFGRDANTNGVLDICERSLSLGWDCGEWRMRSHAAEFACQPATTNVAKRLDFFLHVDGYAPQRMHCRENGTELDWGFASGIPPWVFDPDWDMLRLTVRGVDCGFGAFNAAVKVEGSVITFR